MEEILHFAGQRRLSNKTRHYTVQPTMSDNEKSDDEKNSLSPMIKKKSHFSKEKEDNKPTFTLQECELNEDESHTPLKLKDNFQDGASKDKNFSKLASKNDVKLIPPVRKSSTRNKTTDYVEDHDYEKILINPKNIDFTEKIMEKFTDKPVEKEEFKTEQTTSFANKKKIALRVNVKTHYLNENKSMEEINSSDKIENLNKKKSIEGFINNHPFRNLIFSPSVTESTFKRHLTITYRGLVYAKKCLKGPSESYIRAKQVNLVDSKTPRYKTLLMDLDETLVHTCSIKENPDNILKTSGDLGEEIILGLNIRPFCLEFLEKISKNFEIFVFTASSPNYANSIVNFLDPYNQLINGILTRNNCMETKNGFFIKDLRVIKNRDLKNIFICDNLSHSFGFQIENGIPILEFHNDKKDRELKFLMDYLLEGLYVDDVREFNKKKLKLNELANMSLDELNAIEKC